MKPSTFLSLYEKLEGLVHRLPESLQQPILREITPIKTLFLLQRAPRLVLLGPGGTGKVELVNALFGGEALRPGEENLSDGTWQEIGRTGRGTLKLLDARRPASLNMLRAALAAEPPDLFVFVRPASALEEELAPDLEHAEQILGFAEEHHGAKPRLLGVLVPGSQHPDPERARQELNASLHSRQRLSDRMVGTLAMSTRSEIERLAELIAIELPGESQLEMARLSGNRALQAQIAKVVIKSMTAICAAIGTQPIPLADFPILTSLQATMVAGIMHISGREWSPKLAGEFIAALGANIGAGLVLREGARAAAKFVPIWGNAISGAVAGAGTYAVGRAATAYFIEGVSLPDARSVFRRRRKEKPLLKD
ncbi:MAG: uncharacterized protein QOE70_5280 [Chthoniobacter sp.]|jgi:uncharacterized protein (DUF697 family)|nr:uncharacterized protein [Chthoniobacter sp.]